MKRSSRCSESIIEPQELKFPKRENENVQGRTVDDTHTRTHGKQTNKQTNKQTHTHPPAQLILAGPGLGGAAIGGGGSGSGLGVGAGISDAKVCKLTEIKLCAPGEKCAL